MTGIHELFAGGLIVTALAAGWRYVKLLLGRLAGLVIQRVEIENGVLAVEVLGLLVARFGLPRVRDLYYEQYHDWSRSERGNRHFAMERLGVHPLLFRRGWRFVLLLPPAAGSGASASGNVAPSHGEPSRPAQGSGSPTLLFLRGTLDVDVFVADAMTVANRRLTSAGHDEWSLSRFAVFRFPSPRNHVEVHEHVSEASHVRDTAQRWHRRPDVRRVGDLSEVGYLPVGSGDAMARLYYPPEVRAMVGDVRRWRDSKAWHEERGLPHRRGWLVHGGPGTGKTSLARAFALDLKLPLCVFALGELTNDQFLESWGQIGGLAPCIALFEDLDNVFHGRDPVTALDPFESGLFGPVANGSAEAGSSSSRDGASRRSNRVVQFDTLLNCIDGVDRAVSEGLFTIITTNRLDRIDPALGGPGPDGVPRTRPGRIDRVIELGPICRDGKRGLLARIAAGCPRTTAAIAAELDAGADPEESPAQFEFRAGQMALAEFMGVDDGRHASNGHASRLGVFVGM